MILAKKKKKNVTNVRNIRTNMKMDEKKRLVFRPTIRTIRNVNDSKEQRITDALESRAMLKSTRVSFNRYRSSAL